MTETTETTETVKPTLAALIEEHKLQDEANTMMADNRRKLTAQNTELVTQLEQLKKNSALTNDEKSELQVKISQLEEQYMTAEELAKRESNNQQKQFETDLSSANESSKRWEAMYSSSTIDRALFDAAVEADAIHPSQIVTLLKGNTQLMEAGGNYSPVVKFNDISEEGKNVVLDLSPTDTIKRMKELTNTYGNLFKGTSVSGVGGTGNADGNTVHPKFDELMKDPAKYAVWRKDNPDLDISKLRR